MRIISGKYKGRVLAQNKKLKARPTTDKAKEALFNILNFRIDFEGIKALDLFSGTGNISFELASRGVAEITAVELQSDHVKHIYRLNTDLGTDVNVIRGNVFAFLKKTTNKFDIVFADPPFDLENFEAVYAALHESGIVNEGGMLVIEHGSRINFTKCPNFAETRNYGKVNFSFFEY